MELDKYIPVWEFAKKYNVPRQKVYRLIREHKLTDIQTIKKTVSRILIKDRKP